MFLIWVLGCLLFFFYLETFPFLGVPKKRVHNLAEKMLNRYYSLEKRWCTLQLCCAAQTAKEDKIWPWAQMLELSLVPTSHTGEHKLSFSLAVDCVKMKPRLAGLPCAQGEPNCVPWGKLWCCPKRSPPSWAFMECAKDRSGNRGFRKLIWVNAMFPWLRDSRFFCTEKK